MPTRREALKGIAAMAAVAGGGMAGVRASAKAVEDATDGKWLRIRVPPGKGGMHTRINDPDAEPFVMQPLDVERERFGELVGEIQAVDGKLRYTVRYPDGFTIYQDDDFRIAALEGPEQ